MSDYIIKEIIRIVARGFQQKESVDKITERIDNYLHDNYYAITGFGDD